MFRWTNTILAINVLFCGIAYSQEQDSSKPLANIATSTTVGTVTGSSGTSTSPVVMTSTMLPSAAAGQTAPLSGSSSLPPKPSAGTGAAPSSTSTSAITTNQMTLPLTKVLTVTGEVKAETPDAEFIQDANEEQLLPAPGFRTLNTNSPPQVGGVQLSMSKGKEEDEFEVRQWVLASKDMNEAKEVQRLFYEQYSAKVIRRYKLKSLGMVLSTFRLPEDVDVESSLQQLKSDYPEFNVDLNHFYRPLSSASRSQAERHANYFSATGYVRTSPCDDDLKIGMIDGPINKAHSALMGRQLVEKSFVANRSQQSSQRHGTAIASILIGNHELGAAGLVPTAELFNAIIMSGGDHLRGDMSSLLRALDWLIAKQVNVINMSFGGRSNQLLELAINSVISNDILIVAAAGNGGNSAPVYPAAYHDVIAVSAVDQRGRLAKNATIGEYIDIAAPGVSVWVADEAAGWRYESGSSIAAPWVSAAIVLLGGDGGAQEKINQSAADLGVPGKDIQFGVGLLQFNSRVCE